MIVRKRAEMGLQTSDFGTSYLVPSVKAINYGLDGLSMKLSGNVLQSLNYALNYFSPFC